MDLLTKSIKEASRGIFGKVHGMWWWDFRVTDAGHQHRYDIDPRL